MRPRAVDKLLYDRTNDVIEMLHDRPITVNQMRQIVKVTDKR